MGLISPIRPRRGLVITLGHSRRGWPVQREGDMSKNGSPCKRAREIAHDVHVLWRQPGNEGKFEEQFTAFISEAAEYRQQIRQQNQTENGPLWAEAAPSLASKFTRLASLHDQCLQETEKILDAVPGASGEEDQAWWASECAYAWIRPALKGDTKRLDALEACLTDVRAALDASDSGRPRVQAHSPLWFEYAKRHGLTPEEYQSILDENEKAWRKAKRTASLPFPLPDNYKNGSDPRLPADALAAVREYRLLVRHPTPDPEQDEDQLKKATDVALDVRLSWSGDDLDLPEVPLAENPKRPTQKDFMQLEQWFLTAKNRISRELAKGRGGRAEAYVAARSLPEEIVQLCDEMLRLGREPGSGVPFVVSATAPGKQEQGSQAAPPEAEDAPAVGTHRPRSGPSGLVGRMGVVWDDQWDALAAEFDRRAAQLADLVTALDPSHDVGTLYSPQPVSVWEAYPKARKAFTEAERKWHREYELARGKTEAEADAILDQLDRITEGHALTEWTKNQWPGFVREAGGHRVFLSGPALVHAFDRRFKALKLWAEQFQGEPAERTESQGARSGGMPAKPGASPEAKQLREIADAFRRFLDEVSGNQRARDQGETGQEAVAEQNARSVVLAVAALDLAAQHLDLLSHCRASYGGQGETDELLTKVGHWAALDAAGKEQQKHAFETDFEATIGATSGGLPGEGDPWIHELGRWAEELDQAAVVQGEPEGESAGQSVPEGEWSKPMTKAKMMDILGLDSYKTFNAFAKQKGIRQAGNRRTWQLRLDGLDRATRERFDRD